MLYLQLDQVEVRSHWVPFLQRHFGGKTGKEELQGHSGRPSIKVLWPLPKVTELHQVVSEMLLSFLNCTIDVILFGAVVLARICMLRAKCSTVDGLFRCLHRLLIEPSALDGSEQNGCIVRVHGGLYLEFRTQVSNGLCD